MDHDSPVLLLLKLYYWWNMFLLTPISKYFQTYFHESTTLYDTSVSLWYNSGSITTSFDTFIKYKPLWLYSAICIVNHFINCVKTNLQNPLYAKNEWYWKLCRSIDIIVFFLIGPLKHFRDWKRPMLQCDWIRGSLRTKLAFNATNTHWLTLSHE